MMAVLILILGFEPFSDNCGIKFTSVTLVNGLQISLTSIIKNYVIKYCVLSS